jgi:mannose-6-phosphate isomerase
LARAGFNRENAAGIPLDAPNRSFKDDSHKPEMIVAITEMHALAGLRSPRVILRILEGLNGPLFDVIRQPLLQQPTADGLKVALTNLLELRADPAAASLIDDALTSVQAFAQTDVQYQIAHQTVCDLATQYPGDIGAFASYLMNRVTLQPGEAIFLGDGEIHAYIQGLGIEVMANSTNVVRAALTSKPTDIEQLAECAIFRPRAATRPEQFEVGNLSHATIFKAPAKEFGLTMIEVSDSESIGGPISGPRILIVLDGELKLQYGGTIGLNQEIARSPANGRNLTRAIPRVTGIPLSSLHLSKGDSIFIPDAIGPIQFSGSGQAACAWVP